MLIKMVKFDKNKPYGNQRWRNLRASFLRRNPLCAHCSRVGVNTQATIVDHIIPHEGDMTLMWSADNFQSLCPTCHGAKRMAEEVGYSQACDSEGYPIDANHVFNKRR